MHTGTIIISDEFIMYELENLKQLFNNKQIDINFVKKHFNDLVLKSYNNGQYFVREESNVYIFQDNQY